MIGKTILRGMAEIEKLTRRDETTIKRWVENDGFPAALVDGIWQAVEEDVIEWMRAKINNNGVK